MIRIADFSESMKPAVLELILSIQHEEFGFDMSEQNQPDLSEIPNFYQSRAGGFWVALAENEVVGTIALRDIGNNQGALRKMFVKATHRGSKHGVAAALLEHLVRSAEEKGVHELYLGTTEKFVAAHRFYEKNGFSRVGLENLPESFPRMSLDTRFYRRTLQQ